MQLVLWIRILCPCRFFSTGRKVFSDAGTGPAHRRESGPVGACGRPRETRAVARPSFRTQDIRHLFPAEGPSLQPEGDLFDLVVFDEENADKEDLESILDECIALSLPSVHLKWHYRSRHESLIAFSNAHYYENALLTFPSIDDLSTRVRFQPVEGVYDRGRTRTNEAEAEAVAEEVKRRLSDPAVRQWSIGIVTFNASQKNLIDKKIEELFAKNKALARLSSLGRHFCDDDVNEMVSTTVSNVGVVAHRMRNQFRILFEEVT